MKKLICLSVLFFSFLSSQQVQLDDSKIYSLRNDNNKISISNTGKVLSIENFLSLEIYDFLTDQFELQTDHGAISNSEDLPIRIIENEKSLTYIFDYGKLDLEELKVNAKNVDEIMEKILSMELLIFSSNFEGAFFKSKFRAGFFFIAVRLLRDI